MNYIKKYAQNILNLVYSEILSIYFKLFEPLILLYARTRFKRECIPGLVSIIIATYNRSEILINRTLPSVLSQSYQNIEVIVVGDKCIDNTADRIKKINDSRLIFYDLKKRGVYPKDIRDRWFVQGSVPRNKGMKLAKGEWLCFISDDDILFPHHVTTLVNAVKALNLEFISAAYIAIKDGVELIVYPKPCNFNSNLICGGMQTWLYKNYLKCFTWNRHSWRKKYDRPVDYDLQQRFYSAGVKMGSINDIVFLNPAVEGTNTSGYEAAILADNIVHCINHE